MIRSAKPIRERDVVAYFKKQIKLLGGEVRKVRWEGGLAEALEYDFTPLSMWEYWYLAQVVSKYLGDVQSAYLTHLAYERVRRGIAFISGELQERTFSTEERNSICRAQINLENEIQKWTKMKARE